MSKSVAISGYRPTETGHVNIYMKQCYSMHDQSCSVRRPLRQHGTPCTLLGGMDVNKPSPKWKLALLYADTIVVFYMALKGTNM